MQSPSLRLLEPTDTLYVGIDVSKERCIAGLLSNRLLLAHRRFERCPTLTFEQSRTGFAALLRGITRMHTCAQTVVLLESTGHYHKALVSFLLEHGIEVYIIHVQKRASSMLKSDKYDALSLALHLYNTLEKQIQITDKTQRIRRAHPDAPMTLYLARLAQHRVELVSESTRRRNKLTAICDEIFPEYNQVFRDVNAQVALSYRIAFPTPAALAGASIDALCALRPHNFPSNKQVATLADLAASSIGVRDPGHLRGLLLEQSLLIDELILLRRHLEHIEAEMIAAIEGSREGRIVTSIPPIGPIQAASILACIGSIDKFERAAELKAYAGWAPRWAQTGTSMDHMSLSSNGNRLFKQTIFLVAMNATHTECEWQRLYERLVPLKCSYDARTKQYTGRLKVIGRVAGEIVEMIFRLLKRDATMLAALPAGAVPPPPELYDASRHASRGQGQGRKEERIKQA
ncbi:MAG: transposase [Ktedonobacteraceae bacterium]|nr:transposase [Ktedonobacteraceae bacterium]